ncbi:MULTISPECIES: DUF2059 domain-containing protein [unclassified Ruegeria]|uniref:DUF2059 domain-containing protein n=1 Tax=unclassified Ruegeria TaxID=2625375 RepID=UPI0014885360|nr:MULTISPECIES: DUF2059 domain-containing protein [unclassified Ruegeria]NOD46270.1 DUF2059 domain-containing protein [Ruegeria sp. HKCCD5849]NOD50430.1 DUF2059 domain-containing protein [Ruegeria sp. HKCCD5851]NOD67246.1 DUF2059 domain-containing protein [Ruegeria sp. HKCCD7303]NOE32834.1 DUF2059 domain-containing protein [Ruegeria sp. HKCCD7318]
MTQLAHRVTSLLFLAALTLVLAVAPLFAANRDRIEAFLTTTGFDVALESITLSSRSAPEMLGIDPDGFGSDWARLTDEVFDVDAMHETAVSILEETLTDKALAHAVEFYASDLGQRLVAVENDSHMNEDDEAKQLEGQQIISDLIKDGSQRVESFKRMNAAIDSTGTALRAWQEIQLRFLLAASASGVIELQTDAEGLRELLKRNEPAMRQSLQLSSLAGAAYTYQDFSDEDVNAYVEALEQPLMQEVYELLNVIQFEIMARRFEVLAARMADLHPAQDI